MHTRKMDQLSERQPRFTRARETKKESVHLSLGADNRRSQCQQLQNDGYCLTVQLLKYKIKPQPQAKEKKNEREREREHSFPEPAAPNNSTVSPVMSPFPRRFAAFAEADPLTASGRPYCSSSSDMRPCCEGCSFEVTNQI